MRRQHRSRTKVFLAMFLASAAVGGVFSGVATATYAPEGTLAFEVEPTTAVKNQTISGQTFTPEGTAIRVRFDDDDGEEIELATSEHPITVTIEIGANPGGGVLSGDTSEPISYGVATFDDLSIDKAGLGFTLIATAYEGIADATSASFDIVDAGGLCESGGCQHSASAGTTTASLNSNSGGSYSQFLALDVQALDCPHYPEVTSVVTFGVNATTGTATVTLTVQRAGLPLIRKLLITFQVCYGSPKPFKPQIFTRLREVNGEFIGLLPECFLVHNVAPCIVGRSKTATTFSVTFSTPPGDPRGKG